MFSIDFFGESENFNEKDEPRNEHAPETTEENG